MHVVLLFATSFFFFALVVDDVASSYIDKRQKSKIGIFLLFNYRES